MSHERKRVASLSDHKSSPSAASLLFEKGLQASRFSLPAFLKEKTNNPWIAVPLSKNRIAFYQELGAKIYVFDLATKKLANLDIAFHSEAKSGSFIIERLISCSDKIIAVAQDKIYVWGSHDLQLVGKPMQNDVLAEAKKVKITVSPNGRFLAWLKEKDESSVGYKPGIYLVVVDLVLRNMKQVFLEKSSVFDMSEVSFKTGFCFVDNQIYLASYNNLKNRYVDVFDVCVDSGKLALKENEEAARQLHNLVGIEQGPEYSHLEGVWRQSADDVVFVVRVQSMFSKKDAGLDFYKNTDGDFIHFAYFKQKELYEDCYSIQMAFPGVFLAKTTEKNNFIIELDGSHFYPVPRTLTFSPDGYLFDVTSENIMRYVVLSPDERIEKLRSSRFKEVDKVLEVEGKFPRVLTELVGKFFSTSDHLVIGAPRDIMLSERLPKKACNEFAEVYSKLYDSYKKKKESMQYARLYVLLELNQMLNDFPELSGAEIISRISKYYVKEMSPSFFAAHPLEVILKMIAAIPAQEAVLRSAPSRGDAKSS